MNQRDYYPLRAMAGSFFGSLKTELYYRRVWPTRKRAKMEVGAWIEDHYNRRRRQHASLGQITHQSTSSHNTQTRRWTFKKPHMGYSSERTWVA